MERSSVWPGVGGVAFAVLYVVGVLIAAPPGGNYSSGDIHDFVAHGHRAAAFIGVILTLLGVIGLIALLSHFRREQAMVRSLGTRIYPTASQIAVTGLAIGAVLLDVVPIGMANGGHPIPDSVTYMFVQVGFAIAWGVGGTFLGVALIAASLGGLAATMPKWLRNLTTAAGVLGLASLAFFPFVALPLWALTTGIWLLASRPKTATPRDGQLSP